MKVVIFATLLAYAVASPLMFNTELDAEWGNYKNEYSKAYEEHEEALRRMIWEENVRKVQEHNLAADRGEHTFWMGVNEYADMTNSEFVSFMNGYKMRNESGAFGTFMAPENVGDMPATVDWRTKGYVTGVKNQGHCGSCWSFSATGSLEGQHFRSTGKLVSLSEQNLIDCSKPEGNHGCQGGLMDKAFEYIKMNKGIDTEESYPYKAKNGMCHFMSSNVGATLMGYKDIMHGSEKDLMTAVATVGPISVAIDAGHPSFQLYKHGVYYEPKCSSKKLYHGVLAVGYGTDMGEDYWLVKNSWGTSWGMDGYVMMSRNRDNNCGIATQASYPEV